MPEIETIDENVGWKLELVTYEGLTQDELRKSSYPDSKFGAIFMDGVNEKTGYGYSVGFVIDYPRGPYLKIDTEPRRDFLKKGSERKAEEALKKVAFAMRSRTGGYFNIHPFYGAIWGTHFNPITDFIKGKDDEDLTTFIYITDNGKKFKNSKTREAVSMGKVIEIPGTYFQRFTNYIRGANKKNPNQRDRNQAFANDLGKQWDAEFKRYNPQAKRGLLTRLLGRKTEIPPAMNVTQGKVAEFMDYLQEELQFRDLRVTQANYKGLTLAELAAATFPPRKISGVFDQHNNRIK